MPPSPLPAKGALPRPALGRRLSIYFCGVEFCFNICLIRFRRCVFPPSFSSMLEPVNSCVLHPRITFLISGFFALTIWKVSSFLDDNNFFFFFESISGRCLTFETFTSLVPETLELSEPPPSKML